MKKTICFALLMGTAMNMAAQTSDLFIPHRHTDLRLPSVPLVVSDPYFSIWSPYNTLNEGCTRHWTDAEKPLEGILRVDGKNYRFLGVRNTVMETIVPMADEGPWKGAVSRTVQAPGWEKPDFDDSGWTIAEGAFGSPELSFVRTPWSDQNSDLYVRRVVELTPADLEGNLFIVYSHDDVFNLFLNGTKVADTGETWRDGVRLELTPEMKKLLHPGKNVIASHCHNTTGGAYTDFGLYRNVSFSEPEMNNAMQNNVDVTATSTYYNFTCGPVDLDVVFTA
ncbi:MAG: DUF4964 domain-containing protein, partial [Duncaniella sp.]|nr:DUF4964 domain-containing protein [Duncaniella sp.]